ncbi:unnamed protein product [Fraxinus pennsylvanica]|uniref:Uncharacterized protein n=1 Tax=Fraxinus pennsylvanica TaxID=56036 RepID=A0AAD1YYP2_9LAMI|nr:unnamed protein product [Fraxinus pennsylvanica]
MAKRNSCGLVCSLPIEAEEELRKRKALQSTRQIEAKMKRFEKLKNGRVVKEKFDTEKNSCGDNNNCEINVNRNGNEMPLLQGSIGLHGSGSSGITYFQNPRSEGIFGSVFCSFFVLILFD